MGILGRRPIGGSKANQKRFPVTFDLPLVEAVDETAASTDTTRSELLRNLVGRVLPHYRAAVGAADDSTHVGLEGTPCPLCDGYVNALHRPGCGYFGPGAQFAPEQDAQRLTDLAERFDRANAHPALSVAAAMARLVHCYRTKESGSPEEAQALTDLAEAHARLSAVMTRVYRNS